MNIAGYSYLWNRDINAALNILQNYQYFGIHGCVPEPFQRGYELPSPARIYRYTKKEDGRGFNRWLIAESGYDSS